MKHEAQARETEREAKWAAECKTKDLGWWACRRHKSRRDDEYDDRISVARETAEAALEAEEEAKEAKEDVARKKHLASIFKHGKKITKERAEAMN